jgi:hypothetical protein
VALQGDCLLAGRGGVELLVSRCTRLRLSMASKSGVLDDSAHSRSHLTAPSAHVLLRHAPGIPMIQADQTPNHFHRRALHSLNRCSSKGNPRGGCQAGLTE